MIFDRLIFRIFDFLHTVSVANGSRHSTFFAAGCQAQAVPRRSVELQSFGLRPWFGLCPQLTGKAWTEGIAQTQ
jgi:hypothetical protein